MKRYSFSPFSWSKRQVRLACVLFFSVVLPMAVLIGLKPSLPAGAESFPTLEIQGISLRTPVEPLELIDHRLATPDYIAGAFSQNSNKILIIGHSSTVFRRLDALSIGEIVVYGSQEYIVTKIETLAKEEIYMDLILESASTPTIIMMTCTGESLPGHDATHRLIITAELSS